MSNYNKKITFFFQLWGALSLLIAGGCASEDLPDEPPIENITEEETQAETSVVPLLISIGKDWNIDISDNDETRAAPPGTGNNQDQELPIVNGDDETKSINKVMVFAFRRKDDSEPFKYDRTNSTTVDVISLEDIEEDDRFPVTADIHTSHRKAAQVDITKVFGFEYRIVAIAFDSELEATLPSFLGIPKGANNRFDLNISDELTYESFFATFNARPLSNSIWSEFYTATTLATSPNNNANVTHSEAAEIPQLFFGECFTEMNGIKSEIIKYSDNTADGTLSKTLPIKGILYRGMAKVEVNVTLSNYKPSLTTYPAKWVALTADRVVRKVNLQNYDCFLREGTEKFNDGLFMPVTYAEGKTGDRVKLVAYFLPCRTRLALRVCNAGAISFARNGWLRAEDQQTNGTGTGIISPDSKDGYFYLRRNHKYVINVSNTESLLSGSRLF